MQVAAGAIQAFIEGDLFRYRQAWRRTCFKTQTASIITAPLTLAAVLTGMFFFGFSHGAHSTAEP